MYPLSVTDFRFWPLVLKRLSTLETHCKRIRLPLRPPRLDDEGGEGGGNTLRLTLTICIVVGHSARRVIAGISLMHRLPRPRPQPLRRQVGRHRGLPRKSSTKR